MIQTIAGNGYRFIAFSALAGGMIMSMASSPAQTRETRSPKSGEYPLNCVYQRDDWVPFPHCARRDEEGIHIAPVQLAHMTFRGGLAEAFIDSAGWSHIRRDGRALPVLTFDNGPDPFVHGAARGARPRQRQDRLL